MDDKIIYETWEKIPEKHKNNMLDYQNWFDNNNDSIRSVVAQGHIDLHTKIITQSVYDTLGDIKKKTCLEIGFGGGRLLNAASQVFLKVKGIDIHNCFNNTKDFLNSQNCKNYELYHYNDIKNISDDSVDFVYSFIVFQHFDSIDFFYSYLDLIKRILVKGGCSTLHLSKNIWNSEDYYMKYPGETNSSIFYSPSFVKKVLIEKGFKIIDEGQMTKSPWTTNLSGQFFVVFKK